MLGDGAHRVLDLGAHGGLQEWPQLFFRKWAVLGFPLVDQPLLGVERREQTQALVDRGREVPSALGSEAIEELPGR